ncbi:lysozyme inhibitor LprI family protein [Sphingomonas sp. KRR8]|uniref:lysozyme inhibitor LprI family protein n=1 Tax=Sphingomonas sp. KRR8 TaxID=2942996 RepID=UPI002021F377|nr:lysozyme inhibitor LprI family protein [Sphingomonas sp. KRR8]URD60572.1 lysozyme inhibitor LprI family protein [Sphingomonas sp. KRR8]
MIAVLLAAAALADCGTKGAAILIDRCRLAESIASEPDANCAKQNTQFDLNVCSFREYLRADIELNQAWDGIKRRLSSSRKGYTTMLAGQKAWLTYRDKQCQFWEGWYEGGSIAALVSNSCLTDITKVRSKELGQQLKDLDH